MLAASPPSKARGWLLGYRVQSDGSFVSGGRQGELHPPPGCSRVPKGHSGGFPPLSLARRNLPPFPFPSFPCPVLFLRRQTQVPF